MALLFSIHTRKNHKRKQLKTQTISEQAQRKCKDFSAGQHSVASSSLVSPANLRLSPVVSADSFDVPGPPVSSDEPGLHTHVPISDDLDIFRHDVYDTHPVLSSIADVNPGYVHVHKGKNMYDNDDFPDEDAILDNTDLGNKGDYLPSLRSLVLVDSADDHDPFIVEHHDKHDTSNLYDQDIPSHLLVMYTMVTWLHLQFHLPCIACNAVLAFLGLLLRFFQLCFMPPFITLQSTTRALGVDPGVELLAVCPGCQGIYPSSSSRHVQEECTSCHIPLFLPDHMRQGNLRVIRTPVIKYPYLPLSEQIILILKNLGVEAVLDEWHTKPRNSGEYNDIFDGRMCHLKLKAPDGSLFFSNCPHKRNGPDNELWIGVNLGVDWYVLCHALYDLTCSCLGFLIFVVTLHPCICCV